MPRVYLPLIPLPVLAVVVAVSACSKARTEETTRVIPPAQPYLAATVEAKVPEAPPPPEATSSAPAPDDAPTALEVKEFERPVRK